jgi:hypothetical protein
MVSRETIPCQVPMSIAKGENTHRGWAVLFLNKIQDITKVPYYAIYLFNQFWFEELEPVTKECCSNIQNLFSHLI